MREAPLSLELQRILRAFEERQRFNEANASGPVFRIGNGAAAIEFIVRTHRDSGQPTLSYVLADEDGPSRFKFLTGIDADGNDIVAEIDGNARVRVFVDGEHIGTARGLMFETGNGVSVRAIHQGDGIRIAFDRSPMRDHNNIPDEAADGSRMMFSVGLCEDGLYHRPSSIRGIAWYEGGTRQTASLRIASIGGRQVTLMGDPVPAGVALVLDFDYDPTFVEPYLGAIATGRRRRLAAMEPLDDNDAIYRRRRRA